MSESPRWPFQLMTARSVAALPEGDRWAFEPKFDGFRVCAWWNKKGAVRLQSRQGRSLTHAFPELVEAVAEQCAPGTVLDGEIVCWRGGAFDFTALLGRLGGAGTPTANLAVFDLLADAGRDLRGLPYLERRARLGEVLGSCGPRLGVIPYSRDCAVAAAWLTDHTHVGIEGVVAKRVDQHYAPARSTWRKIRTRLSDEAVVGGVVGDPAEPHALVLGRLDAKARLRVAGCTAPLPVDVRGQIGPYLEPAGEHPWPAILQPRFGDRVPLIYTRVEPRVVVELDVDTARDRGRWRHLVNFRRIRLDLRPEDLAPVGT